MARKSEQRCYHCDRPFLDDIPVVLSVIAAPDRAGIAFLHPDCMAAQRAGHPGAQKHVHWAPPGVTAAALTAAAERAHYEIDVRPLGKSELLRDAAHRGPGAIVHGEQLTVFN